jgi:hypothetical protein
VDLLRAALGHTLLRCPRKRSTSLHTIPQGHAGIFTSKDPTVPRIFTNLALGAAYTPLAIGPDGLIYAENHGHLFVVAVGPGGDLDRSAPPTRNPPPTTVTDDSD